MPEKVLLATDGSKDAALAARAAVDVCEGTGAELHATMQNPDVEYPGDWGRIVAQRRFKTERSSCRRADCRDGYAWLAEEVRV